MDYAVLVAPLIEAVKELAKDQESLSEKQASDHSNLTSYIADVVEDLKQWFSEVVGDLNSSLKLLAVDLDEESKSRKEDIAVMKEKNEALQSEVSVLKNYICNKDPSAVFCK